MLANLHLRSGLLQRLWISSLVVLTSSSFARAQQPVTYTTVNPAMRAGSYATPAYTYQAPRNAYAPQYYQTTYAPQYYQAVQPAAVTYQPTSYAQAQPVATAAAQPVATAAAPAAAQPAAASTGDAYGFLNWLNATRASYGLAAVGYDANLESWASVNNSHQNARGMGHHVMGTARRQNSAMGAYANVPSMWMASPAHRAALLDPTIRWIGIAGMGAYWTFNAN